MKRSVRNHLRRLLGWVRCDIGQSPAELQQTMIDVADGLGHPDISPEAKTRIVESYRRAESIPLYVRAAVKALEKTLAAGGPDRGAEHARAAPETRASVDFDPGADAGHESALNDVQVETGLAEIGIHAWGPRAEDWLAGAEYAARHLRGNPHSLAAERGESDASAAAEPLQSHPNAAANGVACRATPAQPPTLRRIGAADRLLKLAAALGNRDWKWWDSCSFRRLTFEDGPDRRDGGALCGWVQPSDGHPDVSIAPGVREFIEAASPKAIGLLCARVDRLASQLRECAETLGADLVDEHRASRAYADCQALLQELEGCAGGRK